MNKIFPIRANMHLHLSYLKHLQTIDPSSKTITKPLSKKVGETFCEGLK